MTVEQIWTECLEEAKNQIIKNMKDNGKWASGKTASLITVSNGSISLPEYLYTLEEGRGPGNLPKGIKDILIKWAASKGISFTSKADMDRWIYFTIKKIKESGTEQFRNKIHLDIYTSPLEDAMEKALELTMEEL